MTLQAVRDGPALFPSFVTVDPAAGLDHGASGGRGDAGESPTCEQAEALREVSVGLPHGGSGHADRWHLKGRASLRLRGRLVRGPVL